jgi:Zn-finger nucleic acid-binding protein
MNCENCGAPLRLVDGRDHFCCDHCETFRFAAPLADSIDRITLLGQADEESCPVCQTPLAHAALDGARVLCCETCRGVLAESDIFAHVTRRRRAEYERADVTPPLLDREQFRRELHCPACAQRMETHPYYGPGNVVIDSCARCRLVWVDYGELAAIERAPGVR